MRGGWGRRITGVLGTAGWLVVLAPALALIPATFVDRGSDGSLRLGLFPAALTALDPFAWESIRNSVALAALVTLGSGIVGLTLARIIMRWGFWGRRALAGLACLGLALTPASMALGLAALASWWEWSEAISLPHRGEASLAWLLWFWAGTVSMGPLVGLEAARAIAPARAGDVEDAARLAGASRARAWRHFMGPSVRPRLARVLGFVFTFSVLEPGAPLVLGLERTLASQAVVSARAATAPGQLSRAVVLVALGTLLAMGARTLIDRWGGPVLESRPGRVATRSGEVATWPRAAGFVTLILAAVGLSALPLAGLVALVTRDAGARGVLGGLEDPAGVEVQALVNAALLGVGVAVVASILARGIVRAPGSGTPTARRLAEAPWLVPPMALGVGVLALHDLFAGLAVTLGATESPGGLGAGLGRLASWMARGLDLDGSPWVALVLGVTVALAPLSALQELERHGAEPRAAAEAAMLLGARRGRARRLADGRPAWLPTPAWVLTFALAFTAIGPAIVLAPTARVRPLGPAMTLLAQRGPAERADAARLALIGAGIHLAAIGLVAASWTRATRDRPGS